MEEEGRRDGEIKSRDGRRRRIPEEREQGGREGKNEGRREGGRKSGR